MRVVTSLKRAALWPALAAAAVMLGGCLAFTLATPSVAIAQDEDAAAESTATEETDTGKKKLPDNMLLFYIDAMGWTFTILFLITSFIFVALAVMCFLMLMRDKVVPPRLVEIFEAHLNDKRYQEAYEVAKADQSVLGLILSAGLAKLSAGYPQALEAMQEVGDDESMKMEQKVGYVALIGAIAPMLGLLGTVVGMTDSFAQIAASDQTPKPQVLAQGINKALVTTVVGLFLAIPAVALFAWFKNRTQRLMLEAGMISEGLMSRFQSVSTKKP